MEDAKLILNFLNREYQDDHIAIYLYCCGGLGSNQTALNKILPFVYKVFSPPIPKDSVKNIVVGFLEYKKTLFFSGEIKVKPIYL